MCSLRGFLRTAVLAALLAMGVPPDAVAQSIQVPSNRLFETTSNGKRVSCAQLNNGRWVPGALKRDGRTFTPHAAAIKKISKQLESLADEAKRSSLEKKRANLQNKQRAQKAVCANGPGGNGGNPGPSPTPTPPPSGGCFQGDKTSCFGIPSGVQGNKSTGASLWITLTCQSCHTSASKKGKTFSQIQASFSSQPLMSGLPVPNTQQLADLTAYLNAP